MYFVLNPRSFKMFVGDETAVSDRTSRTHPCAVQGAAILTVQQVELLTMLIFMHGRRRRTNKCSTQVWSLAPLYIHVLYE